MIAARFPSAGRLAGKRRANKHWCGRGLTVIVAALVPTGVAAPAAAQEISRAPFSAEDLDPECSSANTACLFEMGPVPAGHRWELRQVACDSTLQSTAGAEIATLSMVGPGNTTLRRFALTPVKLTGNRFAISQRVAIAILNRTIVRINIQTDGALIAGGAYCTISGDDVEVPQP
jgi:hypothetical protein